ncbi:hypothetical protein [Palleronia pelagia]|uniref:Uncharacterized protein n=1 Tax=Palleronia pelagia TaxID=387096 RepID=A0A1H8A5K6_9RHOB|nr:hypothetical protein [Palleronia pelagia]SEM66182.1 hypothetical protein SAMN04488011_10130 [Palleronia pelagia]
MRRGPVVVVLVALAATALGLGLVLGLRAVRLDEGAVIALHAERWAEETGGRVAQCVAVPGQGRVWLRITCDGPERRVIGVSRLGFEIDLPEAGI